MTLDGVLAFPAFGGEKDVRLKLFHADWSSGGSGAELALADMEFAGGAHGGWAFRFEDVPVGTCQLHVDPLLKGWMIEVPSGGREDVELVIPELAEVFVDAGVYEGVVALDGLAQRSPRHRAPLVVVVAFGHTGGSNRPGCDRH